MYIIKKNKKYNFYLSIRAILLLDVYTCRFQLKSLSETLTRYSLIQFWPYIRIIDIGTKMNESTTKSHE